MCDNSSAEATINKLMTTSSPMCFFAQQSALVALSTAITLDCHHVSGFRNESADMLSRLDSVQFLPRMGDLSPCALSRRKAPAKAVECQCFPRRYAFFGSPHGLSPAGMQPVFVWPDPVRPCHNASATRQHVCSWGKCSVASLYGHGRSYGRLSNHALVLLQILCISTMTKKEGVLLNASDCMLDFDMIFYELNSRYFICFLLCAFWE